MPATAKAASQNRLTLGTAKIARQANGSFLLTYMNEGSWLVGERTYGREADAREFCSERGLRVI